MDIVDQTGHLNHIDMVQAAIIMATIIVNTVGFDNCNIATRHWHSSLNNIDYMDKEAVVIMVIVANWFLLCRVLKLLVTIEAHSSLAI